MNVKIKRMLLINLPYVLIALLATKLGEAWRYSPGLDISQKVLHLMDGFPLAFQSLYPSLLLQDLILGIGIAAVIKLAVYVKGRNAKKYRKNIEYGSARWGRPEDIKPFIDPTFRNNVILTETERLTMNNRPKDPRLARNKNVMVVGGSGSGKTRFWLKPNLMQCHSSYVVTDPKGSVVVECGQLLLREGYRIKILNTINFSKSMHRIFGHWLEIAKNTIQLTTYASYASMCKSPIVPYFKDKKIKLVDLKPKDIQEFYTLQLKRVKASTVIHYHTIIHRSLKYAVKIDVIPANPASKIERPRQERFIGSFYDKNEVNQLFEVARGTKLEIPILLGAFYGLRKSEAVGLKWSAIDFNNNTLIVRHTVTSFSIDGKEMIYASDSTKNKSSMRTLPLVPAFKEKLLAAKAQQESNRKLCGRSYSKDFLDYICVNELGVRIRPNYVTTAFPKLLEEYGLRKIRFHDLRHSCASLLLANNVPMKQIQDWLGHSDFATTANIYAHLDFNSKLVSAQAMVDGLNFVIEPKPEI